ncbi:MAG: hypothetical protein E7336_03020 [Clostridiales bacterium]|nr:hypothetical protein [Clostridiales bacterium]
MAKESPSRSHPKTCSGFFRAILISLSASEAVEPHGAYSTPKDSGQTKRKKRRRRKLTFSLGIFHFHCARSDILSHLHASCGNKFA